MSILRKFYFSFLMTIFSMSSASAIDGNTMFKEVSDRISHIDSSQLKKMVDGQEKFVLIDVRMPTEIKRMGSIDIAENKEIPRGWLELRISRLVPDKNTPIVTYCGGGYRSAFAADTLTKMGYTHVKNHQDGFLGWEGKNLPVKYYE